MSGKLGFKGQETILGFRPYTKYKSSGVDWLGKIPNHWGVKFLKYSTRLIYGESLPSVDREGGDIKVFGSNGPVGNHDIPNTSEPVIIIGRKGSFGKINYSSNNCFAIDTTYFIDPNVTDEDIKWLFYILKSLNLDSFSEDSAVPGLSRGYIYNLRIPDVPLIEQKKTATFLDQKNRRIGRLIERQKRWIELLEEKRMALISHAVTKGLDPDVEMKDSGVEWLGKIPKHWEIVRIKYILKDIIDTEHKTAPYHPDGDYLVVRTSNIRDGKLILSDTKYTNFQGYKEWTQRGEPEPGDVIFTREAPVGESCLVPKNIPLIIGQRTVLFKINKIELTGKFLVYALYSDLADEFIQNLLQGSTVPHLNMADIKNIPIVLPPLVEQDYIVNKLHKKLSIIDGLIDRVNRSNSALNEYRVSIISAAVTGKIDVRDQV